MAAVCTAESCNDETIYEENWTEGHYATWRSEVAFAIFGLHL